MKTYAYGLPRLGQHREYKKAIEALWKGTINEKKTISILSEIQNDNIALYKKNVDMFPDGEMTFYDPMLDTAIMCGVYDPQSLPEYYGLCRGQNALEMTKWFNTNYHYLVPDFSNIKTPSFKSNSKNPILQFKQSQFPHLIGPFTFLKLARGLDKKNFRIFFMELIKVYEEILFDYEKVQIDEPAFVMDVERYEVDLLNEGYQLLEASECKITLMTYYDSVDFMEDLLSLPVSAIGIDFVRGGASYEYIMQNGFPGDKTLIAGLVNGRNI